MQECQILIQQLVPDWSDNNKDKQGKLRSQSSYYKKNMCVRARVWVTWPFKINAQNIRKYCTFLFSSFWCLTIAIGHSFTNFWSSTTIPDFLVSGNVCIQGNWLGSTVVHTKTSWKSIFHCILAKKVQKTSLAALTLFNIIFPDA